MGCCNGPAPRPGWLEAAVLWNRVAYEDIKRGKPQEAYNYAKVASVLADYGFECQHYWNDVNGADFIAHNAELGVTLPIQQKSAMQVEPKYRGKGLWIVFQWCRVWYLIKHDELWDIIANNTTAMQTKSFQKEQRVFKHKPSKELKALLEPYCLGLPAH